MFGLQSLDVMIGLITIYLSLALACTAIVEMIAAWTNLRSKNLEAALREILASNVSAGSPPAGRQPSFLDMFYNHALVQSLSKGQDGRPSYIPPEIFSTVVKELLTQRGLQTIEQAIDGLPDSRVKYLLQTLATEAKGVEAEFLKGLEVHFDRVMDRASGWVKTRQQLIAMIVSTVMVVFGNVDTFAMASALSSSPEARAKILESAGGLANPAPPPSAEANHTGAAEAAAGESNEAVRNVEALVWSTGLPFGWQGAQAGAQTIGGWASKLVGLLVSVFAVSLGAPFWFEILKRFVNIRQAGISPREKQ